MHSYGGLTGSSSIEDLTKLYRESCRMGLFERARGILIDSKTIFMTLDIEKYLMKQGLEGSSFDIVVASNVLHAVILHKETMKSVTSLLKPGGHLLLLETTRQWSRSQFVMCGLLGWWLGFDDGRKYASIIAERPWHTLLQNTGYSGLDSRITSRATSVKLDTIQTIA
ncbi:uncharacterized protein EAE98_005706 [Botrytis deweyae]|uniref:Methyltransferase type 11 domain-containing protein n=1 Tax=Botrytis deweyae TaxID=2478750 RepID=A0ABQ7IMI1_9HELO|nr:uncharacterized protein EAE98_005706 [Botrytis deweyae]KAF7928650.1 hypothetical protein EAE98_005706 [Botrytis deweyae]